MVVGEREEGDKWKALKERGTGKKGKEGGNEQK